ncbi:MAG: glycosyltransferase [Bdellovibrio sp.]
MKKSQLSKARNILIQTIRGLFSFIRFSLFVWRKQGTTRFLFFWGRLFRKVNEVLQLFQDSYYRESIRAITKEGSRFESEFVGGYRIQLLTKLSQKVEGLHQFLESNKNIKFSILMPVYHPEPIFFMKAVRSALSQSPPFFEILIGFDGDPSLELLCVLEDLRREFPNKSGFLSVHTFRRSEGHLGGISATTNELAKLSTGTHLVLLDHDDWIRPDLLFRYQQTIQLVLNQDRTVFFCNEYKIDEEDDVVDDSYFWKKESPVFPYFFINSVCHCLCIPKSLWVKVRGLRKETDGAQDYDLCLRLDLVGADFVNVPFMMYAWRQHSNSTALNVSAKSYAHEAGVRALTDYVQAKNLNWEVTSGHFLTSYRAIPKQSELLKGIHVIIPFRDQKKFTLEAVEAVLKQNGVRVFVSAIDNGSSDKSIAEDLEKMGVEIIYAHEPFNYSRLNNNCVKQSKVSAQDFPYLLFLNNDVVLDLGALFEMSSWIDEEKIGVVGARLHYEDNSLQHVGVELEHGDSRSMNWSHRDLGRKFENVSIGRTLGVCDAVTGACLMIKRTTFEAVDGFDEIFYPIAYSDTDLCRKVRRMGLYCFYTPFAFGRHYESVSRGYENIEDFEASSWLFTYTENRISKVSRWSTNHLLDRSFPLIPADQSTERMLSEFELHP